MKEPATTRPNQIRHIRLALGLTLHEVATQAGTTPTQIARLEKGTRGLNAMWEQRLARAMGVEVAELYDGLRNRDFRSKLLPTAAEMQNVVDNIMDRPLDREFLLVCFRYCTIWIDRYPEFKMIRFDRLWTAAFILHDVFFDLYSKLGKTPELLAAISQFLTHTLRDELNRQEVPVQPPEPIILQDTENDEHRS